MKEYLWNILVALTQLLNTLLGGWPDETTSSRLWRMYRQGNHYAALAAAFVDVLFFWQRDHCRKSYEAERKRYQVPPILR